MDRHKEAFQLLDTMRELAMADKSRRSGTDLRLRLSKFFAYSRSRQF